MRVIELSQQERDEFLAGRRLAVLATNTRSGYPSAVPLWYGWDGSTARMFSMGTAGKVKRLRRDPRASLLIANLVGEPVRWVALEGQVEVDCEHGLEAAERLLARYVDDTASLPGSAALELFRSVGPLLVELRLVPGRIRTYAEID